MNRKETLSVMTILKAAYPNFYCNLDKNEANGIILLWETMFKNEPVSLVLAAVKSLIETDVKGYPPHIGAVKEKIRLILAPDETTEIEAWHMVYAALCRGGIYNSKKEFDKLPEEIQEIVGSPNQLKEWAIMDSNTVQSVVSSNFQRSYRAKMKRKQEFDKLPDNVKMLVDSFSKKMMLKDNND